MFEQWKKDIGVTWIKSSSGQTYLCSASALAKIENPTEDDLRRLCVNESENPQND